MSRPPSSWICHHEQASGRGNLAQRFVAAPLLLKQTESFTEADPRRRTKIWEFNQNLHCSIIGTCLSTAELRQLLGRLGLAAADATDHDLHGTAVSLAARHDQAAKLLNKALDQRHRLVISQFARARNEAALQILWRDAVGRGDIPGAYWATLTHPACSQTLIREAFGEVHMLSHLVGAANRADIRRLVALERQQSETASALARQQTAFHQVVVARDTRIRALEQVLLDRASADAKNTTLSRCDQDSDLLEKRVADLEKRLAAETKRRIAAEEQLTQSRSALQHEHDAKTHAEAQLIALAAELAAIEARAIETAGANAANLIADQRPLIGVNTVLYVGGRTNQIAHLRQAVEQMGATFLHHDGGREQHPDLVAGLISRADLVLFPVDCISHDAALNVKRLCRQAAKPFIPLRTASLAALLLAVQGLGQETHRPECAA